jgi:hypothetical protein
MMSVMAESEAFVQRTARVWNKVFKGRVLTPEQFLQFVASIAYKRGSRKDKADYRGLSIRSRGAAAYEKVGHSRISNFIEANNGFDENMNGGRRRRGTATSLSMLAVAWDVVDDLVVIAMDVAKCFPTADRDVMLLELARLGVWGDAWRLIANLDDGLKGRVCLGLAASASNPHRPVSSALPPSHVLSGLLVQPPLPASLCQFFAGAAQRH